MTLVGLIHMDQIRESAEPKHKSLNRDGQDSQDKKMPLDVISSILFILSIPVDYSRADPSNQCYPRSIFVQRLGHEGWFVLVGKEPGK
jgi:hypothetical protein